MPRNPAPVVPRWKRGKVQHPAMPVQLRGRHARAFTRELARNAQPPGSAGKEGRAGKAAGNDVLASTGAWRFRRHMAPFAWLTGLIAAGLVLHRTSHPLLYGNIAGLAVPVLMILLTRQGPPFIRRAADVAAVVTSVWLTLLGAFGLHACIPWLLLTWAPCAALWVRQYRWRPAEPGTTEAVAADAAIWERLAAKRRWSGRLADREDIPGGRKYQIRLDGIETHIGQVMSEPRAIAAAFHKPQTEAYV